MNLENMKVFVIDKKYDHAARVWNESKTGPFPVLMISVYGTRDDYGHCLLIQDGLKLRSIDDSMVEIVTPLTEALR